MFEIKGKAATAICYAKVVEDEAIQQIRRMCDYDLTRGSKVRIMPDVHAGKGCTIGTTMTINVDEMILRKGAIAARAGEKVQGIYSTSVNADTFDEAPMAYKSLDDIIDVIRDSVDIIDIMKPVYNFKASDSDVPWKKRGAQMSAAKTE